MDTSRTSGPLTRLVPLWAVALLVAAAALSSCLFGFGVAFGLAQSGVIQFNP